MNYGKIYDSLISRALERTSSADEYYEKHHIIPKCIGGDNSKSNLVLLTASEHFLAHQLLVKMHPENHKLVFAAHMMINGSQKHKRVNNKEFSWLKARRRQSLMVLNSNKIFSEEHKRKLSLAKKGKVFATKNNFYGKSHTEEFKIKQSAAQKIKQLGAGNNNAKEWKLQFPDGSINIIRSLKTFCVDNGLSLYRMRNNTMPGYVLLGEVS
jgi:hypothetical protein